MHAAAFVGAEADRIVRLKPEARIAVAVIYRAFLDDLVAIINTRPTSDGEGTT